MEDTQSMLSRRKVLSTRFRKFSQMSKRRLCFARESSAFVRYGCLESNPESASVFMVLARRRTLRCRCAALESGGVCIDAGRTAPAAGAGSRRGLGWETFTEPPEKLDAAIIFAPAGEIVPAALKALRKGGTLVLGGIHMSPIPSLDYNLLYQERVIRSVANNTRQDGENFLRIAAEIPIRTRVQMFPLSEANRALNALKNDAIQERRCSRSGRRDLRAPDVICFSGS